MTIVEYGMRLYCQKYSRAEAFNVSRITGDKMNASSN